MTCVAAVYSGAIVYQRLCDKTAVSDNNTSMLTVEETKVLIDLIQIEKNANNKLTNLHTASKWPSCALVE